MASEETVFRSINLPAGGRDWRYYPDLNILAFREGLSCEDRQRCMDEAQQEWRERHQPLVEAP